MMKHKTDLKRQLSFLTMVLTALSASPFIHAQTHNPTRTTGDQSRILTNIQTGANYTVVSTDCGKLLSFSNNGATAVTLPQAAGAVPAGCWMDLQNTSTGTVTLSATGSTIDGASTVTVKSGQGLRLVTGSQNYYTQRGLGASTASNTSSGAGCIVSGSQNSDLTCNSLATNGAASGEVDLYPAGDTNYIGLAAPPSVASAYKLTLPGTAPANGQAINFSAPSSGAATGSWVTPMLLAGTGSARSIASAASSTGQYYVVTDASSSGDCTIGGGTLTTLCRSNGTTWTTLSGGGSSGVIPYDPLTSPTANSWASFGGTFTSLTSSNNKIDVYNATSGNTGYGEYTAVSGDWTHTIGMNVAGLDMNAGGGTIIGAMVTDGTQFEGCFVRATYRQQWIFESHSGANYATMGAGPALRSLTGFYSSPIVYFKLSYTAASSALTCSASFDGSAFRQLFSHTSLGWSPIGFGFLHSGVSSNSTDMFSVFGYN